MAFFCCLNIAVVLVSDVQAYMLVQKVCVEEASVESFQCFWREDVFSSVYEEANSGQVEGEPSSVVVEVQRAWINLSDENIKFTRNIVEFNLSLKTHFLNKLSSTVACTNAYCPSCNTILQIRI